MEKYVYDAMGTIKVEWTGHRYSIYPEQLGGPSSCG